MHRIFYRIVRFGAGHGEDQFSYPLRIVRRQMLGDHAAHGNTQHIGFFNAHGIHGSSQLFCHVPGGEAFRQGFAPAEGPDRMGAGKFPVQQRHGDGGASDGFQAVAQTRQDQQIFLSGTEADIVQLPAVHEQIPVQGIMRHKNASFWESILFWRGERYVLFLLCQEKYQKNAT